jgi:hypothetical protein
MYIPDANGGQYAQMELSTAPLITGWDSTTVSDGTVLTYSVAGLTATVTVSVDSNGIATYSGLFQDGFSNFTLVINGSAFTYTQQLNTLCGSASQGYAAIYYETNLSGTINPDYTYTATGYSYKVSPSFEAGDVNFSYFTEQCKSDSNGFFTYSTMAQTNYQVPNCTLVISPNPMPVDAASIQAYEYYCNIVSTDSRAVDPNYSLATYVNYYMNGAWGVVYVNGTTYLNDASILAFYVSE